MNVELLQFILAKGAGDSAVRRLLSYVGIWGENSVIDICLDHHKLFDALKLREEVCRSIVSARSEAERLFKDLSRKKVNLLWQGHPDYPKRLSVFNGNESPPILFVHGNRALLEMRSVGFYGSRKASEKGLSITARSSRMLVDESYCIVSGYAQGVDMAAHIEALGSGGSTIFVLADGILRFGEKREVKGLLNGGNHLVVSQFPPLLTWTPHNAMKRNSTIIGLSDAMILVESGARGGTFAAGEETLKMRRPLFVIDFAAPGPSAEANPYFIKKGGLPIRGNKNGQPNLSKLIEISGRQEWRGRLELKHDLFNYG